MLQILCTYYLYKQLLLLLWWITVTFHATFEPIMPKERQMHLSKIGTELNPGPKHSLFSTLYAEYEVNDIFVSAGLPNMIAFNLSLKVTQLYLTYLSYYNHFQLYKRLTSIAGIPLYSSISWHFSQYFFFQII